MEIQVLDHGYVKLVEVWGSEERIIEAARQSTSAGFKGWGPITCPGCKDSPVAGSVWQKLFIDDGMGTEMECPTCKGSGEVSGDEKLLSYLYKNQHLTPFEMAGFIVEVQAPIFVFREWHR
jgi:thymidylate synthase (FAD)